jgi:hypothetical protein
VFVLGDGEHLLFGQAAQTNAILKRDHIRGPQPAKRKYLHSSVQQPER